MAVPLRTIAYRAVTSPLRMMPDFLVLGTHRGGTSAFYHYLTGHPAIGAAMIKELCFFDQNFQKGPLWYRAHFPTERRKRQVEAELGQRFLTGEATPSYLFHPLAPARAAQVLPTAKLIVLLRDPVERAFSHYRRSRQKGWESLDFASAITEDERRLADGLEHYPLWSAHGFARQAYLARGLYAEQLERWFAHYPREQFLILRSEDFYRDQATVLEQALEFLGVSATGLPREQVYDRFDGYLRDTASREGNATIDSETRSRLRAFFAPHNQRLCDLLGRDMAWE